MPRQGCCGECRSGWRKSELAETSLLTLTLLGADDPQARELLSDADQAVWDAWFSPPDIDF